MLVGRNAEFGALVAAVQAAAAGTGCAVCVEGDAGIGKTALVEAVVEHATAQDPRIMVLRAVGVESEFTLGHAGLLDLLTPLLGRLDELPAGQRRALGSAVGRTDSVGGTDRFLIAVATLSLLSLGADKQPLLLVVDDLPWIDAETAAALHFSARRVGHDRIALLFTRRTRTGPGSDTDLPGVDRLTLAGLPPAAAEQLLAGSVARPVVEPLVARTGGNPLALLELTRSLTAQQRRGSAPLPDVLPVGPRLTDAHMGSITELSAPARRAAVLAAAGLDTDVGPLLRALETDGIDAATALAEAESAGVLVVVGHSVLFRHPLLRNACWRQATVGERRSAHATLAAVHSHRPGSRLRHLAEASTGPDDNLGADLLGLASREQTRSGYAAASALAERASALLSAPGQSLDALADAMDNAVLSGDVGRVKELSDRILEQPVEVSPQAQARALLSAGALEANAGSVRHAVGLLTEAAGLGAGDVRIRALFELLGANYLLGSAQGMADAADAIGRHADPSIAEQAMLVAYSRAAALAFTGHWEAAAAPAAQALQLIEQTPGLRDNPRYLATTGLASGWAGRFPDVFEQAPARLASARSAGAIGVLPHVLSLLAGGAALFGRHRETFAYAGEAVELGDELGYVVDVAISRELLAWELAARGAGEQAQVELSRARQLQERAEMAHAAVHVELVEAFCALCADDLPRVVDVLEHRLAVDGGRLPRGDYPLSVAPDLVEAYLGLGRHRDALDLVSRHSALHLDSADPDIRAEAHRLVAMTCATETGADAAFAAAHEAHAGGIDRFSAARTRLAHGQRLRRSGERLAAREQLRMAADAFRDMGLDLWVGRAEGELAATGATARRGPRRDATLTSQETRVALYVARGLTNREIAAALFLSPRTVEHHVSSVLRKRGLRSRVELAADFSTP